VLRAYNRFYASGAALRHSPPWSLSRHFGRENFTDVPKYGLCALLFTTITTGVSPTKQNKNTKLRDVQIFFKKTNMGIICALSSFRDEHAAEWPWFTFYIRILNRIVVIIVSYLQISYYKTVPRAYNRFYASGPLCDTRRRGHFLAILGGKISPTGQNTVCALLFTTITTGISPTKQNKNTKRRDVQKKYLKKQIWGSYAPSLVSAMNMPRSGHGSLSTYGF
jgi:hypothetical protein